MLNADGRVSVYEFLRMRMTPQKTAKFLVDQLSIIRNEFSSKTGSESILLCLQKIADRLNIKNDDQNLELLRLCVAGSEETAAYAIASCFIDEFSSNSATNKNNIQKPTIKETSKAEESPIQVISEINCLIRKKVDNDELNKLIHHFLLSPLPHKNNSSQYVYLMNFPIDKK